MDGGVKQEEMADRVKRDIKEQAYRRRGERVIHASRNQISDAEASDGKSTVLPHESPSNLTPSACDLLRATPSVRSSVVWLQCRNDCGFTSENDRERMVFGRPDTILVMFYLDHLLPFLFPYYHPSLLQGGRAWIYDLMISSPIVRKATLCQSSYFFSLACGTANQASAWDTVLNQTTNAIWMLRQAIQVIDGSGITQHLHGAARIMASIMQVQRFEIAVLSFHNWQAHLNASLALFKQLLDSVDESREPSLRFDIVMSRLGCSSSSSGFAGQSNQVLSAEQAAFRFSSTLVIFDDIIASTALQEQPRLYEYQRSLLDDIEGTKDPCIDVEAVIGLQNSALIQIGETAALDAWKHQCIKIGNLDVVELVYRATAIKESLVAHLTRLELDPGMIPKGNTGLLDVFTPPSTQDPLITHVWAHAALIYLHTVVSGWQPANADVRYHVSRVIELLKRQRSPALPRTTVWPFCVAGCLAEPGQEAHFREMAEALQPSSIFGTVHYALKIMENVWRNRGTDVAIRDLATCFRSQGDLVLLI